VLGNSGKPVALETLSMTKFLRCVFQEQGIHDFRKPGTCEASDSRICEVRGSRFEEDMESRVRGSSESRTGGGANFGEAKADSGICRGPSSEVTYEDIHEPVKKQSQSCRPKKSGFWV
jgi:hypothetical protein